MVRFFGQHEFGGTRQWIETAFSQRTQLELAVAVGEICEHEKAQPIWRFFVEGLQDARVVFLATATLEQCFGFFATIASKMLVQQIHHGPQVAAFFHVDLKQVAQVVHAGRGFA